MRNPAATTQYLPRRQRKAILGNSHRSTIAAAAQRGDRNATTVALATTLAGCVGCHAMYRQQVVDEPTWQGLTTEPGHDR